MSHALLPLEDEEGWEAAAGRLLDAYADGADRMSRGLAFDAIDAPEAVGRVAAVDGGSCVLLDLVSCGCVSVRASYTVRRPDDTYVDGPVVERVHVVGRDDAQEWWSELLRDFGWGLRPDLPPPRTRQTMGLWADAARSVLEHHAGRSALGDLDDGDVLVVDGSLEAEPGGPDLVTPLVERAAERGVLLAAVSKDSARTVGGLIPFTLEVEQAAEAAGAPARFLVDVTDALGLADRAFRTFAVRWDRRAPVLRLDVAADAVDHALELAGVLARTANDPTTAGYPYPLARAHRRVRYTSDTVVDRRRAMEALVSERRGSRLGMRLFGRGRDLLELAN